MIYTIDEIRERIKPIVKKYNIETVYLFGSYARGNATEESDVDLLVNADNVPGIKFFGLYADLEEALEKKIDLITEAQILQSRNSPLHKRFIKEVETDRKVIYNDNIR